LCLGDIIENYGIDSLIVDVKVNKTNINIYDKNKKIKAIVNLQFGSN
jgi:putative ubiquitin-RnfH superfamily antitoxin RatB of RatAB toxin-antitoxin module